MNSNIRRAALLKLAYFGPAWVPGAPFYQNQSPTAVGQVIYMAKQDQSMPPMASRRLTDDIVSTGVNVNSPAKNLFKAGIGALAGNFISNALKAGPFVRGLMTATGANYGYNY